MERKGSEKGEERGERQIEVLKKKKLHVVGDLKYTNQFHSNKYVHTSSLLPQVN